MEIIKTKTFFDGQSLSGQGVSVSERRLKDLDGLFRDRDALNRMEPDTLVYAVETHTAVKDAEGGLYFGISRIYPGKVGDEFFMTRGHFHSRKDRAEYYWCIQGSGLLILMGEDKNLRAEEVKRGTLHYIPGFTAHRLVNTGSEELVIGACWPSDSGHDYAAFTDFPP
jgi:glucose-6-phosphate isomerase